jgi:hypothetical protein
LYFSQKNDAGSHYGVAVEIEMMEAGDYVLHVRLICLALRVKNVLTGYEIAKD